MTEASHSVTVIGSVDLDSQIDEYHTGVAQFRRAVCHRRYVRRQRFALPTSFFAADLVLTVADSVANVNSFLSTMSRMKITPFSNWFEQLSLM